MSLLNQNHKKGKKQDKKAGQAGNNASKTAQKPKSSGFVSKQQNTGSQRGG